jgi:hypothetical protein
LPGTLRLSVVDVHAISVVLVLGLLVTPATPAATWLSKAADALG